MKEKTDNIDILEEKEKEAIKDLEEYLHWEELQGFSMLPRDKHIETLLNLVSTLIAENKELKEEVENWKFTKEYVEKNYIDKSKIEKKIEELEKIKQKDEVDEFGIHSRDWWVEDIVQEQFKELLDERNNIDEH